jgi:excisionase family DNA binding protein
LSEFLTTKEVADLLRLKERKVYDLASRGEIPCVKATGKLLFPQAEIHQWIQHKGGSLADSWERPSVILGSHDPVFEWAISASDCGLPTSLNGSMDGFDRFRNREGIVCGIHLDNFDSKGWNTELTSPYLQQSPSVLVHWAKRDRGLIIRPGAGINQISDLPGKRLIARQRGAAAQSLFERHLVKHGVNFSTLECVRVARSETEAALSVVEGEADVTFGLRCFAYRYQLEFVPVCIEYFDLLIDRFAYFESGIQTLLRFTQTLGFSEEIQRYVGYDTSDLGQIRLNGCV